MPECRDDCQCLGRLRDRGLNELLPKALVDLSGDNDGGAAAGDAGTYARNRIGAGRDLSTGAQKGATS